MTADYYLNCATLLFPSVLSPSLSSYRLFGPWLPTYCVYFTKRLVGVSRCCWSLLWKFDMVESKKKRTPYSELHHIILMSENQTERRSFFHFSVKKKSSFLFIKKAASLAGKNFSPLTRNINNLSRREQRSHINHVCMDIFYFKIIFLNLKNIHDCLIQVQ